MDKDYEVFPEGSEPFLLNNVNHPEATAKINDDGTTTYTFPGFSVPVGSVTIGKDGEVTKMMMRKGPFKAVDQEIDLPKDGLYFNVARGLLSIGKLDGVDKGSELFTHIKDECRKLGITIPEHTPLMPNGIHGFGWLGATENDTVDANTFSKDGYTRIAERAKDLHIGFGTGGFSTGGVLRSICNENLVEQAGDSKISQDDKVKFKILQEIVKSTREELATPTLEGKALDAAVEESVTLKMAENVELQKWFDAFEIFEQRKKELLQKADKVENAYELADFVWEKDGTYVDFAELIGEYGILTPKHDVYDNRKTQNAGNKTTQLVLKIPEEVYLEFLKNHKLELTGGDDLKKPEMVKIGELPLEKLFADHASFPVNAHAVIVLSNLELTEEQEVEFTKVRAGTIELAKKRCQLTKVDRKLIQQIKNELARTHPTQTPEPLVESFALELRNNPELKGQIPSLEPKSVATVLHRYYNILDADKRHEVDMSKECDNLLKQVEQTQLAEKMMAAQKRPVQDQGPVAPTRHKDKRRAARKEREDLAAGSAVLSAGKDAQTSRIAARERREANADVTFAELQKMQEHQFVFNARENAQQVRKLIEQGEGVDLSKKQEMLKAFRREFNIKAAALEAQKAEVEGSKKPMTTEELLQEATRIAEAKAKDGPQEIETATLSEEQQRELNERIAPKAAAGQDLTKKGPHRELKDYLSQIEAFGKEKEVAQFKKAFTDEAALGALELKEQKLLADMIISPKEMKPEETKKAAQAFLKYDEEAKKHQELATPYLDVETGVEAGKRLSTASIESEAYLDVAPGELGDGLTEAARVAAQKAAKQAQGHVQAWGDDQTAPAKPDAKPLSKEEVAMQAADLGQKATSSKKVGNPIKEGLRNLLGRKKGGDKITELP